MYVLHYGADGSSFVHRSLYPEWGFAEYPKLETPEKRYH